MVVVVHLPVTSFVMGVVIVGVGVKFVYYVEYYYKILLLLKC